MYEDVTKPGDETLAGGIVMFCLGMAALLLPWIYLWLLGVLG